MAVLTILAGFASGVAVGAILLFIGLTYAIWKL